MMVAGVIGANAAGWVSDLFFQSRRAPAAGGLYLGLAVATLAMFFVLGGTTNVVRPFPPKKDDKKAQKPDPEADKYDKLLEGDALLLVAGAEIDKWEDVTKAFSCVPAMKCKDSVWNYEECNCTTKEVEVPDDAEAPSQGFIPVTVDRGGKKLELKLRDPKPTMRAGDKRKLAAAPVLVLTPYLLGLVIFIMSLCVIGTHGLLSGTATMDFGGRRGAATAVGMIDGFVYLGTGLQSVVLGILTTKSWSYWPMFLFPFAVIGFLLSLRIWNAKPGSKGGGH